MNIKDTPATCGRAEDLVSYLYGEASEIEAKGFERHLSDCGECRQELNALGFTRSAMDTTREEAARTFSPLSLDFISAPQNKRTETPRSALAAFREFFRLAPLWMQAGVALASLVFCALVTLTAFNSEINLGGARLALHSPSAERVVEKQVIVDRVVQPENTFTQAQVDELIKARVQQALGDFQASNAQVMPVSARIKTQRAGRALSSGGNRIASNNEEQTPAPQRRRAPSQFNPDDEDLQLTDLLSQVK